MGKKKRKKFKLKKYIFKSKNLVVKQCVSETKNKAELSARGHWHFYLLFFCSEQYLPLRRVLLSREMVSKY